MRGEGPFLAIEVSSRVGSVALGGDGAIMASAVLTDASAHASSLVSAIARVLGEAGVERHELHGILVGRGPGSFTGVRVGAATARGLAAALGIPIWAISSLAAAAVSDWASVPRRGMQVGTVGPDGPSAAAAWSGDRRQPRYVLFDARQDRLYAACYRVSGDSLEVLREPHATTVGAVLESELPEGVTFAGSGAQAHRDRLVSAGFEVLAPPLGTPSAGGLMRLQAMEPRVLPEPKGSRWEPDYLRGSWTAPEGGRGRGQASGPVTP